MQQQEFEMWKLEQDEKRRVQEQNDANQRHEEMVDILKGDKACSLEEKMSEGENVKNILITMLYVDKFEKYFLWIWNVTHYSCDALV
mmetsp:Transcript_54483/g.81116  ORF Transcript_54483/g.81116 Transcript_54483/m.81116 type:complete len:87 (+) Transcript_54483:79-339(+)